MTERLNNNSIVSEFFSHVAVVKLLAKPAVSLKT